jgi:hypothetical protein
LLARGGRLRILIPRHAFRRTRTIITSFSRDKLKRYVKADAHIRAHIIVEYVVVL